MDVLCRISHSIVSYLSICYSGLITSVGEERAYFYIYLAEQGYVTKYIISANSSSLLLHLLDL